MGQLTSDLAFIESECEKISRNYCNFVGSLRGELALSVAKRNPAAISARAEFARKATRAADRYIDDYSVDLKTATSEIANKVAIRILNDTELELFRLNLDRVLSAYLEESVNLAVSAVMGLADNDIRFGAAQLKTLAFDVMSNMSAGVVRAIKGAVVKFAMGDRNYIGANEKEWRSISNVRTLTRYHLITIFNEMTILVGSNFGDTEFVVRATKNSNPFNETPITIDSYREIKAKAFHPNSNALVYRKTENTL